MTVYVGPKRKRYSIHKALLVQYQWFRQQMYCYSDSDLISRDEISLLQEDPKIFEMLIIWLYRRKFKAISTTNEETAKEEAKQSIDLYLRAYVWGMQELQNALMDRLRVRRTCPYGFFPQSFIKKVYENTEPESPLRSYIVDGFVQTLNGWHEGAGLEQDLTSEHSILTQTNALKTHLEAGNHAFVLDCYETILQLCT